MIDLFGLAQIQKYFIDWIILNHIYHD